MSSGMDEVATTVDEVDEDEVLSLRRQVRYLNRKVNHLEQQANRVRNLTPGRGRIHVLDEVAMLFDIDADLEEDGEVAKSMGNLSLSVRRLEWDLGRLRDAVRGDERRMTGNRNDPGQWAGPRP